MSKNEGFLSINAPLGGMEREDIADEEGVLRGGYPEELCRGRREIERFCRRGGGGERLVYDSGGKGELEGANDKSGGAPCGRLKLGAEFVLYKRDVLRGSFEVELGRGEEDLRTGFWIGVFEEDDSFDVCEISESREPQLLLVLRSPFLQSPSCCHAAPSRSSSAGGTMCCATSCPVEGDDTDDAEAGSEPVPRSSNHEEVLANAVLEVVLSPGLEALMGMMEVSTWSSSCLRSFPRSLSRSCLLAPNSFRRGLELGIESFPALARLATPVRSGGSGGKSCGGDNDGEPSGGNGGERACSSEPGIDTTDGSKEL